MNELKDVIKLIQAPDEISMQAARERQDYLAKVPGSLGMLEEISIKLAGITGKPYENNVQNQAIVLMCADNGVVEEGVASAPQSVTLMQTVNFTERITGVGSQAKYFGIELLAVDIGIKLPVPEKYLTEDMLEEGKLSSLVVNRRISSGTENLAKGPAMSREDAVRGIMIGIEAAEACKRAGKTLIGVGEMGIGNTTTSSAIIAALYLEDRLKKSGELNKNEEENKENISENSFDENDVREIVEKIVGRGGGLSDEGLQKKKSIIEEAIKKYEPLYMTNGLDAIELLRTVGGFDIAGMVGVYIGAALQRVPVVIDGVISIAAALLAIRICPDVKNYLFASHKSKEGGYSVATELLGIEPMFDLGMRLGEGSGCPIAFKIIEAACAVINGMKTLEEAQVDAAYLDEFREDGQFR